MPIVPAQICAIAVAKPWPTAEPPVTSSILRAAHRHDVRVGRLSARHSDIAFRLKPLDL
jgi:hypothetical protein